MWEGGKKRHEHFNPFRLYTFINFLIVAPVRWKYMYSHELAMQGSARLSQILIEKVNAYTLIWLELMSKHI